MKLIPVEIYKATSGKLCQHSDMGSRYNSRTGSCVSYKICNPRNLAEKPYSEKELSIHSNMAIRAKVVARAIKDLDKKQKAVLIDLRNKQGLTSINSLAHKAYDPDDQTVYWSRIGLDSWGECDIEGTTGKEITA